MSTLLSLQDMLETCRASHILYCPHLLLSSITYTCTRPLLFLIVKHSFSLLSLRDLLKASRGNLILCRSHSLSLYSFTYTRIFVFVFFSTLTPAFSSSSLRTLRQQCVAITYSITHKKCFQYYTSRSKQMSKRKSNKNIRFDMLKED